MNILDFIGAKRKRSRDVLTNWCYSRDPTLNRVAQRPSVCSGRASGYWAVDPGLTLPNLTRGDVWLQGWKWRDQGWMWDDRGCDVCRYVINWGEKT